MEEKSAKRTMLASEYNYIENIASLLQCLITLNNQVANIIHAVDTLNEKVTSHYISNSIATHLGLVADKMQPDDAKTGHSKVLNLISLLDTLNIQVNWEKLDSEVALNSVIPNTTISLGEILKLSDIALLSTNKEFRLTKINDETLSKISKQLIDYVSALNPRIQNNQKIAEPNRFCFLAIRNILPELITAIHNILYTVAFFHEAIKYITHQINIQNYDIENNLAYGQLTLQLGNLAENLKLLSGAHAEISNTLATDISFKLSNYKYPFKFFEENVAVFRGLSRKLESITKGIFEITQSADLEHLSQSKSPCFIGFLELVIFLQQQVSDMHRCNRDIEKAYEAGYVPLSKIFGHQTDYGSTVSEIPNPNLTQKKIINVDEIRKQADSHLNILLKFIAKYKELVKKVHSNFSYGFNIIANSSSKLIATILKDYLTASDIKLDESLKPIILRIRACIIAQQYNQTIYLASPEDLNSQIIISNDDSSKNTTFSTIQNLTDAELFKLLFEQPDLIKQSILQDLIIFITRLANLENIRNNDNADLIFEVYKHLITEDAYKLLIDAHATIFDIIYNLNFSLKHNVLRITHAYRDAENVVIPTLNSHLNEITELIDMLERLSPNNAKSVNKIAKDAMLSVTEVNFENNFINSESRLKNRHTKVKDQIAASRKNLLNFYRRFIRTLPSTPPHNDEVNTFLQYNLQIISFISQRLATDFHNIAELTFGKIEHQISAMTYAEFCRKFELYQPITANSKPHLNAGIELSGKLARTRSRSDPFSSPNITRPLRGAASKTVDKDSRNTFSSFKFWKPDKPKEGSGESSSTTVSALTIPTKTINNGPNSGSTDKR